VAATSMSPEDVKQIYRHWCI